MSTYLANLAPGEKELVLNAPVLVTILIAGADSQIDKSEKASALSLAKIKTISSADVLKDYYKEVQDSFDNAFNTLLAKFPSSPNERLSAVSAELTKLNSVWPKLDQKFASLLYDSLKDFAKHIAESSGGFLGYASISAEEKKYIDLDMIKRP
jgi:hypothetical protein